MQKLYWRLHNLEQGEAPQTPQVDAASLESTVRPDELKKMCIRDRL